MSVRGEPRPAPVPKVLGANVYPDSMRALRRALVALLAAGIVAGVLRVRGKGGVPPQAGGWRELTGPDLR